MAKLSVYSHQDIIELSPKLVSQLEKSGNLAVPLALEHATSDKSSLSLLEEVEVSLIDDDTISKVHKRFMDIPGATDVITFDHGEIHISVETTRTQAKDFGNHFHAELMLYIIHGLLHLAGHEDASAEGQAKMDDLQQEILRRVWKN